ARCEQEIVLRDRGQDTPLHPDHRADECIADDEQRKLRQVCTQARPDAHARPWFASRMPAISAGLGGTSESACTNASRLFESIGFQRFSNAMVLDGFPLIPAPHTDPE